MLLTDFGAIRSLLGTGLMMPLANRSMVQNAANGALQDLGGRLFRARAGLSAPPSQGVASRNSALGRFLALNRAQNVDLREALGLSDGEESQVARTDFNSQADLWACSAVGSQSSAAQPFAKKPVVANSAGKEVVADGTFNVQPAKRYEVFTSFDFGYYDQDRLTPEIKGFETDSYSGTLGLEYRLFDWLAIGGAWSHLKSDTELEANLGGIDLEGNLFSGYLTAFHGNSWADLLYAYGDYDNNLNRNTLLGSRALGETESNSHNLALNLGHNIPLTPNVVTGPELGVELCHRFHSWL